MSFEVLIKCDNEKCLAKAQTQQVGALPLNWIGLTYPIQKIDMSTPTGTKVEVAQVVVCSWKCLYQFSEKHNRNGKEEWTKQSILKVKS